MSGRLQLRLGTTPFPEAIPGLGVREIPIGPDRAFGLCLDCFNRPGHVARSFVAYGGRHLCVHDATLRAYDARRRARRRARRPHQEVQGA